MMHAHCHSSGTSSTHTEQVRAKVSITQAGELSSRHSHSKTLFNTMESLPPVHLHVFVARAVPTFICCGMLSPYSAYIRIAPCLQHVRLPNFSEALFSCFIGPAVEPIPKHHITTRARSIFRPSVGLVTPDSIYCVGLKRVYL